MKKTIATALSKVAKATPHKGGHVDAGWIFGQEKDKNTGIAALFRGFWTHSLPEKTPADIVHDLCGVALSSPQKKTLLPSVIGVPIK